MKYAAGIFGVALLARLMLLLVHPFDGLYGQDAFAYYNYAIDLRTALLQGQTTPPFFWPIGFPLHLVAWMSVIGVTPLSAQLVSVIAGALVAPLTYALTREVLINREPQRAQSAALVAGLIVAVGGQLMISSLSIMSDATALLWATLSAWCVLRYTRTLKWPWFGLAVFALSVAVITRWAMALLAVPWTLAVLVTWRQHWTTIGWRRAVALCASAAIIGGVIVGGQLLSGSHTGDLHVYSWDLANVARHNVANTDGAFQFALPMAIYYAQALAHPAYVFPLLLPLLLIGLWSLRKVSPPTGVLLIGWPLICYVFLSGVTWQNPRFMVAYLPPLAVWVAIGFDRLRERDRVWRSLAVGLVGVGLIGMCAWSVRVVANFIDRKDADLEVIHQIDRLVPPDGTLIAFGLTSTARQYTDLRVIELYYLDEAALNAETQSGEPHYLLIDVASIESQWRAKSPGSNYRWLRSHTVLTPIGSFPPYSLFRIDRPAP